MESSSSVEKRKAEILAKKAKLAELKKNRESRAKEFSATRQSVSDATELVQPTPSRTESRKDLDTFITNLIGGSRPGSTGPGSPAQRTSRPTSVVSAGQISSDVAPSSPPQAKPALTTSPPQNLSVAPLKTVFEVSSDSIPERITYSKGVQTSEAWSPPRNRDSSVGPDENDSPPQLRSPRASKRLSRREQIHYEELRQNIRQELEEELKLAQQPNLDGTSGDGAQANFPARTLSDEELKAVNESNDFQDFIEKSTKVIERTLDEQYDVLADYALVGLQDVDLDDEVGPNRGKKGRRVKEIAQFWDERWSKRRMISDNGFSPKIPELVLASYTKNPSAPHDPDGLIQVWNLHMHDRPEYVFHAQSDILTAKFSPFHPNLIVGGTYSGQVLLWDLRQKATPVQKTPLTGTGHTHPVYSVDIVGTQNANNIISCSTDGVVCGWAMDMLSKPQEYLELTTPPPAKTEDMAPTCISFPQSDPTYFLAGSEEGSIYPCHRYDRAGAKAGVDTRVSYRGHAAPVMSLDFHPSTGAVDLGDLVLSSSLDWSVKIWKARPPAAATTTSVVGTGQVVTPLMDIVREDLVYDAKWSPVKPGVFGLVDGSGSLEVWDINVETEVPLAKVSPSDKRGLSFGQRSLNKLAWEHSEGKRVAVGGLDGVMTVFEVGSDLGGKEKVRREESFGVQKLVRRLDPNAGIGNGTDAKS